MFSHPAPLRGPDHDGDLDGGGAVPAKRRENVPSVARGPGNRRAGTMTGVCSARYRSDSSWTERATATVASNRVGGAVVAPHRPSPAALMREAAPPASLH